MLELQNINKTYKGFSLENISFRVEQGDYYMLLGPSGSGKSQILEIIAGLVNPDSGQIFLDGNNITHVSISKRSVGLMFQDLALFPHMTVAGNIGFSLKRKGIKGELLNEKIRLLSAQLGIEHLLKQHPWQLSGGEQQRVALARTLAMEPKVLLIDEPLTSVDIPLRDGLTSLLRKINRLGQTILHVTHDFEEAISLGTKVAVIHHGKIVQKGKVMEVFQNPTSEFIARFSGIKNFYKVELPPPDNQGLRHAKVNSNHIISFYTESKAQSGYIFFPESSVSISLQKTETSQLNHFPARIVDIFPQRMGCEVVADAGFRISALITSESVKKMALTQGQTIWVGFKASAVGFIPAE